MFHLRSWSFLSLWQWQISKSCKKPKRFYAMKPKEKTMTFGKEVVLLFHFMTGKPWVTRLKPYVFSLLWCWCYVYHLESLVMYLVICLQSMHWAVRNKKEPMLEASKAEIPATSQTEDPHTAKESPGIPSHDAMPSSSKRISQCCQSNGKYWDFLLLKYKTQRLKQKFNKIVV